MKYFILIILLIFSFSSILFSQNLLIIGNKSYQATNSFILKANSSFGNDLSIQIAKKESGGIIMLKTYVGFDDEWCKHRIKGNATIYLDDGTIITCVDRKIYDILDGYITTVYYLSSSEIDQLKGSNINTIRYKVDAGSCNSSETGNFSASNKESGSSLIKKKKQIFQKQ